MCLLFTTGVIFLAIFWSQFSTSTQPCVNLSTFRLKRCQQKQPRVVSGPETPPEKHQQDMCVYIFIYVRTLKKKYIYICVYTYHWHSKHQITSTPWHSPFSPNGFPAAEPFSTLGGHWASASTSNPVVSRVVVIAIPSGCVDPHEKLMTIWWHFIFKKLQVVLGLV